MVVTVSYSDIYKVQHLGRKIIANPLYKEIVKDGLVLYLDGRDFKNNPPTSTWKDRSGLGNDATPSNFGYTTISGSDGIGGVIFDKTDDCCNLNRIITTIQFSIMCKIKTGSDITAEQEIFTQYTGADSGRLVIGIANSKFRFFIGGTSFLSNYLIQANTTYTVTFKRDSNGYLFIFIDGVLDNTVLLSTVAITNNNCKIGCVNTGVNVYFLGATIYLILVYNLALTDAEILQNYNASR